MLSREIRRKLSRLAAEGPTLEPAAGPDTSAVQAEPEVEVQPPPAQLAPAIFPLTDRSTDLRDMLGGDVQDAELGPFWLIELPAADRWPEARSIGERIAFMLTRAEPAEDLAAGGQHLDLGLVFLDIETAGLTGATLFLVGVLDFLPGEPMLRFYLARDYAEELPMLDALCGYLESFPVLVSFNGKSFDLPYIEDRMRYHRLRFRPPAQHLDLLHTARRRWRTEVPDCKLQTLERYICGRARADDLPGADIPQVYHEFVATQDARLLVPILQHNALDLLTLAELLAAQLELDVQ